MSPSFYTVHELSNINFGFFSVMCIIFLYSGEIAFIKTFQISSTMNQLTKKNGWLRGICVMVWDMLSLTAMAIVCQELCHTNSSPKEQDTTDVAELQDSTDVFVVRCISGKHFWCIVINLYYFVQLFKCDTVLPLWSHLLKGIFVL